MNKEGGFDWVSAIIIILIVLLFVYLIKNNFFG